MDWDLVKYTFYIWLVGAILAGISGVNLFYYTLGFIFVAVLAAFALNHWVESGFEKERLAKEKADAEEKALIMSMTKEQRCEYAEEKRKIRQLKIAEDQLKIEAQYQSNRRKQLELEEHKLAVAQQKASQAKLPFAAKVAASGYIGYKVGKKIAKW